MANVSTHQSKPSEASAMSFCCSSDDKNSDGKPTTATATTSMLSNYSAASISTTTTAPATNNAVYRLGGTGHVETVKSRLTNTLYKCMIVVGKVKRSEGKSAI